MAGGRTKTHVDQESLRLLIKNLGGAGISIEAAYAVAIRTAGARWASIVKENLSATDHTLNDLAKLDHPYARRHGALTLHAGDRARYMLDGRDMVHRRRGRLVSAVRERFLETDTGPAYRVWLDPSVPEVRYVLGGTKNMLPRDPLTSSALAQGTQSEIKKAVLSRMQRRFGSTVQTKFVTGRRFGGGSNPRIQ